jgi:hypothetical protein
MKSEIAEKNSENVGQYRSERSFFRRNFQSRSIKFRFGEYGGRNTRLMLSSLAFSATLLHLSPLSKKLR